MADAREEARRLVDLLTAELIALIDVGWTRIYEAEQKLIVDWIRLTEGQRTVRIRQLQGLARDLMSTIEGRARGDIVGMLQTAYSAGSLRVAAVFGAPGDLLQSDKDLLKTISDDTWLDVLAATRHVQDTTKEMIRELGKQAAQLRFSGLATAERAGQELAKAMDGRGITAIVYRDGSRHGLDEYSRMLLRTKTAETYQVGGFEQAERLGVEYMELLDNPKCGLREHQDPQKANGLILPLSEARKYPTSHPNCVRSSTARPDIHTAAEAAAASPSTSAAQNADQALVEQQRAEAVASRAARRSLNARAARSSGGLLTPTSGAAGSAAARRNAIRIARRRGGAA